MTADAPRRAGGDRALLALVGVVLVSMALPLLWSYGGLWLAYPDYNYGVLIPPIAVALLWQRRAALRAAPFAPDARGGWLLGAGVAVYLFGALTGVFQIQGLALVPLGLGLILFLHGRAAARLALFPACYLLCGLALFHKGLQLVGFAMQELTARAAAPLATLLWTPTVRVGTVLTSGPASFVVAEPCSGLGSLLALLSLGVLVVHLGPGPLPLKVGLMLAIGPLVLLANVLRVALVLVIDRHLSRSIAGGIVHSLFSVLIFVISVALLLSLRKVLLWRPPGAMRSLPSAS